MPPLCLRLVLPCRGNFAYDGIVLHLLALRLSPEKEALTAARQDWAWDWELKPRIRSM